MQRPSGPVPFGRKTTEEMVDSPTPSPGLTGPGRVGSGQGEEPQQTALPELTPPSLPKGGGAISGLGEKFQTNAFNGTGSFSLPIPTSPGRGGGGPQLALSYNSGSGNGPFGLGFSLSAPAITRKTSRGLPRYLDNEESDVFVLAGAEDLVPALEQNGESWTRVIADRGDFRVYRYRPRIEAGFARIERWEDQRDGISHFRVTDGSNTTRFFGRSERSRIAAPNRPAQIFSWLLDRIEDDRGNVSVYHYKQEDLAGVDSLAPWEASRGPDRSQLYIERIRYGNRRRLLGTDGSDEDWMFEVVFDYGEYGDAAPDAQTQSAVDLTIDYVASNEWTVRSDSFSTYRAGFDIRTHRLCRRVMMFHRFDDLGENPLLVASTDFGYEQSAFGSRLQTVSKRGYVAQPDGRLQAEAMPPVTLTYSSIAPNPSTHNVPLESLTDLGGGVDASRIRLVDLDGDGLPGLLVAGEGSWAYKAPRGEGQFAGLRTLAQIPTAAANGVSVNLADLDGNGRLDLVVMEAGTAGSYEREPDSGDDWGRFRQMLLRPVGLNVQDPTVRQLDVTGDGLADLLVDRGEYFEWYGSAGRAGYREPVRVRKPTDADQAPAVVYGSALISIATADMTGDGLADIVRVNADGAIYWPNLGYGRFGAAVVLGGNRPFDYPTLFRADRLRLADVDGTGPTDLIYFGSDGASLWRNASGNRLIGPETIVGVPPVHSLTHADIVDLEGTGSACIVWSSSAPGDDRRQLRYVRLHQQPPNLLIGTTNGLGLETRVSYTASTQIALAARAAGKPWLTRLPFPVHVVDRVETLEQFTGHRTVATYHYRDGYFDGPEREFRGFAMVERHDTESFAHFGEPGLFDTGHRIEDEALHVPPVMTRTWFHTGAYSGDETTARQFAQEYWSDDPEAERLALPDTLLPAGLSPTEKREALRALKGSVLREEVYSEDGSDRAGRPYSVAESNLAIRLEQPRAGQRHAVFFAHENESLQMHYERELNDPRVSHSLVLDVDAFGAIRRSAQIAYPRRAPEIPEQAQSAVVLTESDVEHQPGDFDLYRLGSPIETRSFELTGIEVLALPFQRVSAQALEGGTRRLLSTSRVLYMTDDLTGPLPLGQVGAHALVFEERAAAFTAQQVGQVFPELDAGVLTTEGQYLLDDDIWWTRSPHRIYDPERFFVITAVTDPFGNTTTLDYDNDTLFVTRLTDAVGNRTEAEIDYRVLAPRGITDLNDNVVEAAFDTLGLVSAVAVRGTPELNEGDTLADPTSRFFYDVWAPHRGDGPAWSRTERRETHRDPDTRWLPQIAYSDGRGQVVQSKVRAEPGSIPHLGNDIVADRWIGTGRTIVDNKGNPIKQYEPYFSATDAYEDEAELVEQGVSPLLHYDPIGRLLRTDFPDGTLARAEWSTWHSRQFDAGDTVLESRWYAERIAMPPGSQRRRAAELSEAYHDTPTVTVTDSLGRPVQVVADLGGGVVAETRSVLDIQGNVLQVIDARDNVAESRVYGLLGQTLQTDSADAGQRRSISDVTGAPLRLFDDPLMGRAHRFEYDPLRRMTHHWLQAAAGDEMVVVRNVYGEAVLDATDQNLRGALLRQYDSAGLAVNAAFDFNGNPLRQLRHLTVAHEGPPNWTILAEENTLQGLDDAAASQLDPEDFAIEGIFDALSRPVSRTTPDASITSYAYNGAGLLESVSASLRGSGTATTYVDNIDYDVRGRRASVQHGNGTISTYEYDALSMRLTRIRTTRPAPPSILQDLQYFYDAAGNTVEMLDAVAPVVHFGNDAVHADQQFEYDPWYRLIRATGREHMSQGQPVESDLPALPHPDPNSPQALRRYTERYEYDLVGNILEHRHVGFWTRAYTYASNGNRLLSNSGPNDVPGGAFTHTYAYDAHGNMNAMPHLAVIEWDYTDHMRRAALGGGGEVFFQYDSAGDRVRKMWVNDPGVLSRERIYLGGYELFRERVNGTLISERKTLHIEDDTGRILMIETLTTDGEMPVAAPTSLTRYQYGNHLGSVSFELDQSARLISYEQFHPYGTTAYRSLSSTIEVNAKRYRYTGVERDEETGLYYMGARYYGPWLGRWMVADPIGLGDGINRYAYAHSSPIDLQDKNGMRAGPPPSETNEQNSPLSVEDQQALSNYIDSLGRPAGTHTPPPTAQAPTLEQQAKQAEVEYNRNLATGALGLEAVQARQELIRHKLESNKHGLPMGGHPVFGARALVGFHFDVIGPNQNGVVTEGRQYVDLNGKLVGTVVHDTTSELGELLIDLVAGGIGGIGGIVAGTGRASVATLRTSTLKSLAAHERSLLDDALAGSAGGTAGGQLMIDAGPMRSMVALPPFDSAVSTQLSFIRGRQLVTTPRVLAEVASFTRDTGNAIVRARFEVLAERIRLVAENPSAPFRIRPSKGLGEVDLGIFGTADRMGIRTLTQDKNFVERFRNVMGQGVPGGKGPRPIVLLFPPATH